MQNIFLIGIVSRLRLRSRCSLKKSLRKRSYCNLSRMTRCRGFPRSRGQWLGINANIFLQL